MPASVASSRFGPAHDRAASHRERRRLRPDPGVMPGHPACRRTCGIVTSTSALANGAGARRRRGAALARFRRSASARTSRSWVTRARCSRPERSRRSSTSADELASGWRPFLRRCALGRVDPRRRAPRVRRAGRGAPRRTASPSRTSTRTRTSTSGRASRRSTVDARARERRGRRSASRARRVGRRSRSACGTSRRASSRARARRTCGSRTPPPGSTRPAGSTSLGSARRDRALRALRRVSSAELVCHPE